MEVFAARRKETLPQILLMEVWAHCGECRVCSPGEVRFVFPDTISVAVQITKIVANQTDRGRGRPRIFGV